MSGNHGITSHLLPFLPYIEKSSPDKLLSAWHWPDSLSEPINISILKTWLSTCDAHHGDHCQDWKKTREAQGPAWLVDVCRRCIVPAESGFTYVALSYVWGQAECASLLKEGIARFLQEGSLVEAVLPRTIRDAMTLVAALGLTYLWVDRLCIVQDDVAEKQAQLKVMGSIYAKSYLTIIAAQSHDATGPLSSRPVSLTSTSGWTKYRNFIRPDWDGLRASIGKALEALTTKLPDLPTLPQPYPDGAQSSRKQTSQTHKGSDLDPWRKPGTDLEIMNIMAVDLVRTVWFSRGWTFQEFLFSRRKIIFHNNTVNWECHCASSYEHQQSLRLSPCPRRPLQTFLGVDNDSWPNFHRYSRLVALFTPRQFTYPEDALDAFAGASSAFARISQGGLVTGLPQMVFDAALIWQPFHPVHRRKPALIPTEEAVLPSWSWVSWLGNVQSESWQSGYDYLRHQPGSVAEGTASKRATRALMYWSTFSTVQWYHSESLTSERRPIQVYAAEWRKRYRATAELPPPGWQRHVDEEAHDTYFSQDSLLDYEFWYPIPMTGGSSAQESDARSRYLHCRTRRAQLRLAPKVYRSYGTRCAVAALEDLDGKLIGHLRLNDVKEDAGGKLDDTYHVIELSSGSVSLSTTGSLLDHPLSDVFDEWALPSWSQKDGLYEFYNIMHIEWNGGIAYRLAIGRVEKSIWERVAREEVDITIG
jgi:hypothetical protein